jgi:hypothetical protein
VAFLFVRLITVIYAICRLSKDTNISKYQFIAANVLKMFLRCKTYFRHYTSSVVIAYHAVCVILVFKNIPEDDPNRDRNITHTNYHAVYVILIFKNIPEDDPNRDRNVWKQSFVI